MENYKTRISVNGHYDPTKGKDYNNSRVANGWTLQDYIWTEDSVRNITTQHGISCNEYSSNHKTTENWVATHIVMLDFDDGKVTTSQLLTDQKNWSFDSYIYSSQNHQKPKEKNGKVVSKCDRLRVLIPLKEPITEITDLKAVEGYFRTKYPTIDQTFMGRSRYFAHGTTEISSFQNSQGPLKWRELPGLDQFRQAIPKRSWKRKTEKLIKLSDQILDADKKTIKVKDILPDKPIYCPFCGLSEDRTGDGHNAVIKINDAGLPFLFCSSCQSRGMGNKGVYNFHKLMDMSID
ncbi:MAG: hypothetical protein HQ510_13190 [Candidatus Marinimicrobia bacterium]|nr:hypothetical protein [Candidatus Neomarinimicrobiota bacterium]